jgi:hypothetical protein
MVKYDPGTNRWREGGRFAKAPEVDWDALEEEINRIVVEELYKWMLIYMPEKTGALIESYFQMMLASGEIASGLYYADFVEAMINVHWTKPTSVAQAKQKAIEYCEEIIPACTQYVFQANGLA